MKQDLHIQQFRGEHVSLAYDETKWNRGFQDCLPLFFKKALEGEQRLAL
ncbi:hypothetical protein HMPREF0972_00444 [Actinomyces sp. oral taxon 848 str. F0332]|nr:hypothetical protein HMPREF0972_00444 [Actinomyces sp. oral taxon 848 str. F0332]